MPQLKTQIAELKNQLTAEQEARQAAEAELSAAPGEEPAKAEPVTSTTPKNYAKMSVNEIRGLLKERGLSPFGKQEVLIQRLMSGEGGEEEPAAPATKKRRKK